MKRWNWPLALVAGSAALVAWVALRKSKVLIRSVWGVPAYKIDPDSALQSAVEGGAKIVAGGVALPSEIHGIVWTYAGKPAPFSKLDPKLAVLIQRLSADLASSGFRTAEHMGVLRENTSHKEARALDLSGIDTFRVLTSWGQEPMRSLFAWLAEEAREVIHPDFPNPKLAATHKDHFHIEV